MLRTYVTHIYNQPEPQEPQSQRQRQSHGPPLYPRGCGTISSSILHAPKLCWQLSVASHCNGCYSLIMPATRTRTRIISPALCRCSAAACNMQPVVGLMPAPFIKCLRGATITLSGQKREEAATRHGPLTDHQPLSTSHKCNSSLRRLCMSATKHQFSVRAPLCQVPSAQH